MEWSGVLHFLARPLGRRCAGRLIRDADRVAQNAFHMPGNDHQVDIHGGVAGH